MPEQNLPTFAARMSELFRDQCPTSSDFIKQVKALTPQDKAWYNQELVKSGFNCLPPGVPAIVK